MRFSASPRPIVVVVLPSPAGVGLMAVTRISLPRRSGSAAMASKLDLGLVGAVAIERLGGQAGAGADFLDGFQHRGAGDLGIGGHGQIPAVMDAIVATRFPSRIPDPALTCPTRRDLKQDGAGGNCREPLHPVEPPPPCHAGSPSPLRVGGIRAPRYSSPVERGRGRPKGGGGADAPLHSAGRRPPR